MCPWHASVKDDTHYPIPGPTSNGILQFVCIIFVPIYRKHLVLGTDEASSDNDDDDDDDYDDDDDNDDDDDIYLCCIRMCI